MQEIKWSFIEQAQLGKRFVGKRQASNGNHRHQQ